jgi:lipopolysaccharide/colanic/teichoic acid biosynthesis glycosyltransferase
MQPSRTAYLIVKRAADIAGALFGLGVLAALFLPVAAAIKLNSRGPVFFLQERLTLGGRPFLFYKFRTMAVGHVLSEEERDRINEMGGPLFKSRLDPRITAVGRVLRKFSLDELPQFINVFKGDMSLVGPRPPLKHEVDRYEKWMRRRLQVRAGITGLWQVSGRSHLGYYRMMELDVDYVDHPSLRRDFVILLRTIPAVMFGRGAW